VSAGRELAEQAAALAVSKPRPAAVGTATIATQTQTNAVIDEAATDWCFASVAMAHAHPVAHALLMAMAEAVVATCGDSAALAINDWPTANPVRTVAKTATRVVAAPTAMTWLAIAVAAAATPAELTQELVAAPTLAAKV
jgi:hypothetical protein